MRYHLKNKQKLTIGLMQMSLEFQQQKIRHGRKGEGMSYNFTPNMGMQKDLRAHYYNP